MIIFFSILVWVSSIIVAGGTERTVEVMIGDLGSKIVHKLLKHKYSPSMVMHNGSILICGGESKDKSKVCLQLNSGIWTDHSTLNEKRVWHSVASTPIATFIFGGMYSFQTYEYLPKNSTTWHMGKTEIPGIGFFNASAVASKCGQKIWLIGGSVTEKTILKFNVNDQTFHEMTTQLNVERYKHRCCFIPKTNLIMITGGVGNDYLGINSTEIYNTEDGSITMASPMNIKRFGHGIGVITINGEDMLAVIGGFDGIRSLDSVELYNTETTKWEITNIKLNGGNYNFGFLEVNLSDIITKF